MLPQAPEYAHKSNNFKKKLIENYRYVKNTYSLTGRTEGRERLKTLRKEENILKRILMKQAVNAWSLFFWLFFRLLIPPHLHVLTV
jgi:hypothetical protein